MKKFFAALAILALGWHANAAEPETKGQGTFTTARHEFYPEVNNRQETESPNFDQDMTKGFWDDALDKLIDLASKQVQSTLTKTGTQLLMQSVEYAKTKLESRRVKWQRAVDNERLYKRSFPLRSEVNDFYFGSSELSPYDPEGLKFHGFQFVDSIVVCNSEGRQQKILAMGIFCSMREDEKGLADILNHRKFTMVVDSVIIRPFLCHLPNDSLTSDMVKYRIPFDFNKRKNWSAQLSVDVTSSWMNKESQWYSDQKMGHFTINVMIPDSTCLDENGVYRWHLEDSEHWKGAVGINGECYMIPRSYIGIKKESSEENALIQELKAADIWGTGEYKLTMSLTESCTVNTAYYLDKHVWKKEWKGNYKPRRPKTHFWRDLYNEAIGDYTGDKWKEIILDPMVVYFDDEQTDYIDKKCKSWTEDLKDYLKLNDE